MRRTEAFLVCVLLNIFCSKPIVEHLVESQSCVAVRQLDHGDHRLGLAHRALSIAGEQRTAQKRVQQNYDPLFAVNCSFLERLFSRKQSAMCASAQVMARNARGAGASV